MNNNRFQAARKFATNIIKENKLTPPIDPRNIINLYGIEIVEKSNNYGIEGFSNLGEDLSITINPEFTFPARINFTLAHELGHIIIPWHSGDVKCNTDKPYNIIDGKQMLDTQELEANIFASELLMPKEWLEKLIGNENIILKDLLLKIQNIAKTSIMACMYALETSLPSGHLYYVKKEKTDYSKKFNSIRTNSTKIFFDIKENFDFLDVIASEKNIFTISQYEVIHYLLCPCPDKDTLNKAYLDLGKNIVALLNAFSDYNPFLLMHCIDYIIESINTSYSVIIAYGNKTKKLNLENSKLKYYNEEYDDLIAKLKKSCLEYDIIENDQLKVIFILENVFIVPNVRLANPSIILKNIVKEIDTRHHKNLLQKINGVMANANSNNTEMQLEELYNILKYRFLFDKTYSNFIEHPNYELYLVNKINKMISNRKPLK